MAKKNRTTPAADAPQSTESTPSTGAGRFKSSVLLGAMLFAPAAFLVLRGNLSINEALVRFGCALLFSMVGTAVVISSMPNADRDEADAAGEGRDSGVSADHGVQAGAPLGVPAVAVSQPVG